MRLSLSKNRPTLRAPSVQTSRQQTEAAQHSSPSSPREKSTSPRERAEPDRIDHPERRESVRTGGSNASKGSHIKTRQIGGTHWMAVCIDMVVLKAMLDKSDEFQTSRKAFAEIKSLTRIANAIPTSIAAVMGDGRSLLNLLPNRRTCERWVAKYCQTYGRIYSVVDEACLATAIDEIYVRPANANRVDIFNILLVIAIAMQNDESERLNGRRLARHVEDCFHSSTRNQKPPIGIVRTLLLLIIIKTIAGSDTDKMYGLLGTLGLTTQVVFSMDLHRNPECLPNVSPYYAEVRKRLWACFFRLNLDYCIRSGTQITLRLEDIDCPLPTDVSLSLLNPTATAGRESELGTERQSKADATFGIVAVELAKVIAPF